MKIQYLWVICILVTALFAGIDDSNMRNIMKENGELTSLSNSEIDSLAESAADEVSLPFIVLRIIGSLAILSGVIFGLVWWLKKLGIFKKQTAASSPSFEMLESFKLNSGGSLLSMVRFEKSVFILGQTSENISLLKTIEGEEAQHLIEDKQAGETVSAFQQSLNTFVDSIKSEKR